MPARKFKHGSSTASFWGYPRCIMLGLEEATPARFSKNKAQ